MKRFGYSFRCGTHISQILNEDDLKNASLFWNEVHNTIKEKCLGKNNIFNMDESPIFFNMVPNKTIAKRGKKTILIKTQNQKNIEYQLYLVLGKLALN